MRVLTVSVTVREPPQPGGVGGARAVLGQQWGGPTLSTRVHLHLGAEFLGKVGFSGLSYVHVGAIP